MGRIGKMAKISKIDTMSFDRDSIKIIEQTRLPEEEFILEISDYIVLADAIKRLAIRGAPAIGIACAFGVYLGLKDSEAKSYAKFKQEAHSVMECLRATRPTAVNLFWALDRMSGIIKRGSSVDKVIDELYNEAVFLYEDDLDRSCKIGMYGDKLIGSKSCVITHCNAGGLATTGYGTALSVIFTAFSNGKDIHVFVDETRPLLQGARLTTWELLKKGIPCTLITDNAACYTMKTKKIDACIVGADRIALNGDVANKIGTYSLAVSAKAHGIPFYVAAPFSTFDFTMADGSFIPIEERDKKEVTNIKGLAIAPSEVLVYSPAFDITPSEYISAIITEKGIIEPPFSDNIKEFTN